MPRITLALLLVLSVAPLAALAQVQTGTLSGTVVDADTQEPLVGVNVVIAGTTQGTTTDDTGAYELAALSQGTYVITFRYIGFEPVNRTDVVIKPRRTTTLNIGLREAILEGEGVTVTAGYFQPSTTDATSVTSFSTEEIRRSPGSAQEISRVLSSLPGVAARGETSQDLFVRGGSPLENAFYIDNIYIPTAQHFATPDGSSFGPTGLINTEFVERLDFFTGGFSSTYGDRLSSVSAVTYRTGNANRTTGEVGLNFAGGTAILEGPIGSDATYFVSARRSYLDLIADAINAGGAPTFSDIQGKAEIKLSPRSTLSILNLYGQSTFEQSQADAIETGDGEYFDVENQQNTAGLTWRQLWQGNGFSTTSVSYSFKDRDFVSQQTSSGAERFRESLYDTYFNIRNVNYYAISPRAKLEFGAEVLVENGDYAYSGEAYFSRTGLPQPAYQRELDLTSTKAGTFVSALLRPTSRLQLTPGLRVDYGSLNEDVYVSPRLSATFDVTERLSLNGSVGVFRQGVPLFIASQAPENENLEHLSATHYVAGIAYLLRPDTRLTVEVYQKDYDNIPELAAGNPLGDPGYSLDSRGAVLGALTSTGTGYARGVDVLLQKKLADKLYGTLSASFFRSKYTDYQGVERNRSFDNRYLFSAIGGYKPNDRWEVSIRWSYIGGRPYTPIDIAATQVAGEEVLDLAQFNTPRLPAYHSLFLRFDRRFTFKRGSLVTFFSLWNAYNRNNVEDFYWNFDQQFIDARTQFSTLPVGGLEFEF
ncbi:MAG: TonB-dependent receptor [Rhodothermales bacterium]